jgi:hypothetical protein
MNQSYLPNKDSELLAWLNNYKPEFGLRDDINLT